MLGQRSIFLRIQASSFRLLISTSSIQNLQNCLVLLCVAWGCSSTALAVDYGFPALNTMGRYWGVGWSHNTYHSCVDGRFNVISNRHPASGYSSTGLTNIYSPEYQKLPPRPINHSPATPSFWQAPVAQPQKASEPPSQSILDKSLEPAKGNKTQDQSDRSTAEEVPAKETDQLRPAERPKPKAPEKPKEPPPNWLKPYLDNQNSKQENGDLIELDPSPSDLKSSLAPVNRYRR